jgi:hypothetical protein
MVPGTLTTVVGYTSVAAVIVGWALTVKYRSSCNRDMDQFMLRDRREGMIGTRMAARWSIVELSIQFVERVTIFACP